jgi:hypothetical protein
VENDRTRTLLVLLAGAILVAGAALALNAGMERLAAARASIAQHEGLIRRLEKSLPDLQDLTRERDALQKDVERRTARFYAADETDPYAFGAVVRRKLASLGIAVLRYQLTDAKGASYLDFSVTSSARAFVLFLRDVSQAQKLWTIPSLTLSVQEATGTVKADFRIGYAVSTP